MRLIQFFILSVLTFQPFHVVAGGPQTEILPKAYLPPQNLSIQESIEQILAGYDAMKTYGELHRTLRAFRPAADHKDLAALFQGHENAPLPPIRSNGLSLITEVPGQGKLEIEIVNIQKSRFRVQGGSWTYDIRKPFRMSLAEVRALIYKPVSQTRPWFSFIPTAFAQNNPAPKNAGEAGANFLHEARTGHLANQAACGGDPACAAEIARQRGAPAVVTQTQDEEGERLKREGLRIVGFSMARADHCENQGKSPPRKNVTAPATCRGRCLDTEKCEKAIREYEQSCQILKSSPRTKFLKFMDNQTRRDVEWAKFDCKKDFYFLVPYGPWIPPAQGKNSSSGGL